MAAHIRATMASLLLLAAVVLSSTTTIDAAVAELDHYYSTSTRREVTTAVEPELAMGCWFAMLKVPSCVFDIAKVLMGNVGAIFSIGKPCCGAFLSLTDDCKIKLFQNMKFLPVIEEVCAAITGSAPPPHSA